MSKPLPILHSAEIKEIFVFLRFYVKSSFTILEVLKLPFLTYLEAPNFDLAEVLFTFQRLQNCAQFFFCFSFERQNLKNLISRKIFALGRIKLRKFTLIASL